MTPVRVAGETVVWTRENIIEALKEYASTYGSDFTTAAFNPATARWRDREDLIDRYYAGRANGSSWPSLNTIKDHFDGKFNTAREAAGLPKNKPGPVGRREAFKHRPVRDIRVQRVVVPTDDTVRLRAELDQARERIKNLEARLRDRPEKVKIMRETDTAQIEKLREKLNTEKAISRELGRELKNALRREERAKSRGPKVVEKLIDRTVEVPVEVPVSSGPDLTEIDRLTARLASAEARNESLRAQLATTREKLTKAVSDSLEMSGLVQAAEDELREHRERMTAEAIQSAKVREAYRQVESAKAEVEAMRKQMAEQAVAVIGELRPLTRQEIVSLRRSGPAGHAVLVKALKKLSVAQKSSQAEALLEVAAAAINWRDRL